MAKTTQPSYNFNLSMKFVKIQFPDTGDILIVTERYPAGAQGISRSLSLAAPNDYKLIEVQHEIVEALIVKKWVLKRLPAEKVVEMMEKQVFPFVGLGECVRVDVRVEIAVEGVEGAVG